MVRRAQRVHELAREAKIDLDEALVTLWDAGLDFLEDPSDLVPARHMAAARRVLDIAAPSEQMTVAYWVRVSGLDPDELADRVAPLGVDLTPSSRRIPKKTLRIFRRAFEMEQATVAPQVTVSSQDKALDTDVEVETSQFEWQTVGKSKRDINYLDEDDILTIHRELELYAQRSKDPILPPGVKESAQVSMSAQRPHTALGTVQKYPTVEMAAAALFHSLILNHGFYNGNKRTALVALVAFLDRNGFALTCSQDDLYKITLRMAQHSVVSINLPQVADREVMQISEWIAANSRSIQKEDFPIRWHKLRPILKGLKCDIENPGSNKLNITRNIRRITPLSKIRLPIKTLKVQVAWRGDSTEADSTTIRHIRKKLELDSDHGVDSSVFYDDAEPIELIEKYAPVLKRLSRL